MAEQVVADMAEVQRLVGVGRGVLDQHGSLVAGFQPTITLIVRFPFQELQPEFLIDLQVQIAFHHVELLDTVQILKQLLADFRTERVGRLAGDFHPREHHDGKVAGEALPGGLHKVCIRFDVDVVQVL